MEQTPDYETQEELVEYYKNHPAAELQEILQQKEEEGRCLNEKALELIFAQNRVARHINAITQIINERASIPELIEKHQQTWTNWVAAKRDNTPKRLQIKCLEDIDNISDKICAITSSMPCGELASSYRKLDTNLQLVFFNISDVTTQNTLMSELSGSERLELENKVKDQEEAVARITQTKTN